MQSLLISRLPIQQLATISIFRRKVSVQTTMRLSVLKAMVNGTTPHMVGLSLQATRLKS